MDGTCDGMPAIEGPLSRARREQFLVRPAVTHIEGDVTGIRGPSRVTGVAILSEEHGLIALPAPNRHANIYALAAFMGISVDPGEQGFVTDDGRFVSRTMAFEITGKGRNGVTYSEDLW